MAVRKSYILSVQYCTAHAAAGGCPFGPSISLYISRRAAVGADRFYSTSEWFSVPSLHMFTAADPLPQCNLLRWRSGPVPALAVEATLECAE